LINQRKSVQVRVARGHPTVKRLVEDDLRCVDELPPLLRRALWDLNLSFDARSVAEVARAYGPVAALGALRGNETRELERFYREVGRPYPGTIARYGERYPRAGGRGKMATRRREYAADRDG
jgi:hypothetical protein